MAAGAFHFHGEATLQHPTSSQRDGTVLQGQLGLPVFCDSVKLPNDLKPPPLAIAERSPTSRSQTFAWTWAIRLTFEFAVEVLELVPSSRWEPLFR